MAKKFDISLSDEQYDKVQREASKHFLTVNNYVRLAISEKLYK